MSESICLRISSRSGSTIFGASALIGPGFKSLQSLADDLVRLEKLAHSDPESRPHVAVRLGRDLKIVCLVTCVRIMLYAGRDRRRCLVNTGRSGPNRSRLPFEIMPTPFVRLCQIVLPVTSVSNVFSASGKSVEELLDAILKSRGQVHHQSADAEIARRHSPARGGLDEVENLFTLLKRKRTASSHPYRGTTCRARPCAKRSAAARTSGRGSPVHVRESQDQAASPPPSHRRGCCRAD